jgi:hypothetical protein
MRENMRTKKGRLDPNGLRDRKLGKFNRRLRYGDKRGMGGVFVVSRRDRGNCTAVLGTARVCVDALVQLR